MPTFSEYKYEISLLSESVLWSYFVNTKLLKMKILTFSKFLLNLLSLWPMVDNVTPLIIIRYIFTITAEIIILFALFLFVIQHLDDINTAIETGFACFAFATTIFIYFWMIKSKPRINSVLTKIETIIEQSEY